MQILNNTSDPCDARVKSLVLVKLFNPITPERNKLVAYHRIQNQLLLLHNLRNRLNQQTLLQNQKRNQKCWTSNRSNLARKVRYFGEIFNYLFGELEVMGKIIFSLFDPHLIYLQFTYFDAHLSSYTL